MNKKDYKILIPIEEYEEFKKYKEIILNSEKCIIWEYYKERDVYFIHKILVPEETNKTLIEINNELRKQLTKISQINLKLKNLSWRKFKKWKKYGDNSL